LYCLNCVTKERPRTKSRQSIDSPRRRWPIRATVRLMLLVFVVVILVDALVGERGLLAERKARQNQQELSDAIARTKAENQLRREEIQRLENDPAAIEDVARRDHNFIRKGEKVFILKDLPSPGK
jgi:cell division protein FtsB